MNIAYQKMRAFWLDASNMQNKHGLPEIGPDKIVAAGVEMALEDGAKIKHLLVATNSLGDSSLYFENNSPSGLGGMIGGHQNQPLQETAAHMLAYAAKLAKDMRAVPSSKEFPVLCQGQQICLWALSCKNIFYKEMQQTDARNPDNPFYPMFAYSQQVIGLFKAQEAGSKPDR